MAVNRKKPVKKASYKRAGKVIRPGAEYEAMALGIHPGQRDQKLKIKRNSTVAEEPIAFYTSRIRAIGNSKGVILNSQVIESSGLKPDADIVIQAGNGVIYIIQLKSPHVNTDLSTWDKQFKMAIKKGAKPEGDMFKDLENEFDSKEW